MLLGKEKLATEAQRHGDKKKVFSSVRPPWMVEVSKMQEQFSIPLCLRGQ